jgi:hypothetical protein
MSKRRGRKRQEEKRSVPWFNWMGCANTTFLGRGEDSEMALVLFALALPHWLPPPPVRSDRKQAKGNKKQRK